MSGQCKESITLFCRGGQSCLIGYTSNHEFNQDEQHPYTLETLKVRLPFIAATMLASEVEVQGRKYQVTNVAGYPAGNRTVLQVARATFDNCNTTTMSLHSALEVDGCIPGFDEMDVNPSVEVLPWHEKSTVVDLYDTRGFDQAWRLYVDHSIAKVLTGTSYFLAGEVQYKVREVVGIGRLSQLPYALCDINRWSLST